MTELKKSAYEMTKMVRNDLGMKSPGYEMTGYHSFNLETYYNFCNEAKEGVSATRPFDRSREKFAILVSHWLSSACRFVRKL